MIFVNIQANNLNFALCTFAGHLRFCKSTSEAGDPFLEETAKVVYNDLAIVKSIMKGTIP